jgi:MYXO-CTERM domain-containing protein
MLRSYIASLTAAMFLIPGCGQPDAAAPLIPGAEPLDLHQPALVADAARQSDPLSILVLSLLAVTAQELPTDETGQSCPRLIDESDRATGIANWRIEGGCVREDADGQTRVEGSIVARGDANGTEIEYLGYSERVLSSYQCVGQETGMVIDGVVRVPEAFMPFTPGDDEEEETPPASVRRTDHYEIDIRLESSSADDACRVEKTELAYDLAIDRTYEFSDTPYHESDLSDMEGRIAMRLQVQEAGQEAWQTTWNGAWRVSAEGYGNTSGDESCFEYITGTLRIEAGGDEAVLQPSLPESCLDNQEEEGPACTAWTLNGKAQPALCDFVGLSGCSAGPDAPPPWVAMFLLVGGLMWQNRRRRRSRV